MTEQTAPSIVDTQNARVARAADLKGRVLAAIAVPETTVPAAIAARLMVGSYLLIKALNDATLINRKVNGDPEARLSMIMQMGLAGTPAETLKFVSARYCELVGPVADRLLDAAEARLTGEPLTGEEPDISVLVDQRSLAYQLSSLMSGPDADQVIQLAGWIANDVSDLANSADSTDSAPSESEFGMAMMSGGSYNDDADDLRAVIKDVPVETLVGEVMTPYHIVIAPFIAELEALVDQVLPEGVKDAARNSGPAPTNFDDALDAAIEKELENDPELLAAIKAGIPLGEPTPRADDAATDGSPAADGSIAAISGAPSGDGATANGSPAGDDSKKS